VTQPDTPGRRFVSALLGGLEGGHTTSAAAEKRGWWREFWNAMAGQAGAVGDSARSQAASSLGHFSEDVRAEAMSDYVAVTETIRRWPAEAAETGDPEALLGVGRLLERRGDLAEAEAWFRRAVETRINERIRVPEVKLVGPNGEQVGIVRTEDALRLAQEAGLDLVEVAAQARPPVCKLMDFGKFKYETAQKARESGRDQQMTVIKEQKLRPKIDARDYETKKRSVMQFLATGHKVKIIIMFRGSEQSRPELGFRLLQRLSLDVAELGFVETSKYDGGNMTMVLAPHRNKSRGTKVDQATVDRGAAQSARQPE
jgi:translation initiation factor IF-3